MRSLFCIVFFGIVFFLPMHISAFAEDHHTPEELQPIQEMKRNQKIAYLTFDDGPSLNTMKILDILDQYNVKATFFVMANKEPYAEASYREMIKRGHSIALHTYSHNYQTIYRSKEAFFHDLHKLETFLHDHYGVSSTIVRLPGGSDNRLSHQASTRPIIRSILDELTNSGYIYVDWHVDSKDGDSPNMSTSEITRNVLTRYKNYRQPIILLHDINQMKATVKSLPIIIESMKKDGYDFDIIDESTPKTQFN